MKNYILTIDTADPDKTAILLAENIGCDYKIMAKKIWKAKTHQSEELLPAIDKLLKQNKVKTENLGLIIVCIGPGSFTGIRIGVATANAFAFGLDVPVIGVKKEENITAVIKKGMESYKSKKYKKDGIASPFYDKAPNITTPKKK
jgi:tRNA threonylcarbamoyl adenosine modification protein YeaZ